MRILGINAYHGDTAAALFEDGRLTTALEEERFRRIKHVTGVPRFAIEACLGGSAGGAHRVDHVAVSRRPAAHLLKKLEFLLRRFPSASLVSDRARNAASLRGARAAVLEQVIAATGPPEPRFHWVEHHTAHLASSFFVSPFDQAAVCAIDGFGDFVSTSWGVGAGIDLNVGRRVFFPHSLGMLYLAVTQYLGFPKYGDEYKVMGLAPYGSPDYVSELRRLVHLTEDGGFELNLSYFCHHSSGVTMTWADGEPTIGRVFTPALEELLGPARLPEDPLGPKHEAIAASVQIVFEEAAFHVLNQVFRDTGLKRLCLAGGCAMNSVMNGKIRERTPFEEVYIQPAAGDNGTALGAALSVQHQRLRMPRAFTMDHAYWGPEFTEHDARTTLQKHQRDFDDVGCRRQSFDDDAELCRWTASRLTEGRVVGWFQGRMEWGARALGHRSILADPRRSDMREIINTKIKFRERFRPFAPSIAEEALDDYFVGAVPDPFMIQVYPVRSDKRSIIPAVTHADGSGRLQTVSKHTSPLYWELIKAFESLTGVPILLNTSFNENEPIVHLPSEAIACFLRTDMDALVLGRTVIERPVPERTAAVRDRDAKRAPAHA